MTICHDIYLCSGTLGKQAIIERIVCMLPKVQLETILSTMFPRKWKIAKLPPRPHFQKKYKSQSFFKKSSNIKNKSKQLCMYFPIYFYIWFSMWEILLTTRRSVLSYLRETLLGFEQEHMKIQERRDRSHARTTQTLFFLLNYTVLVFLQQTSSKSHSKHIICFKLFHILEFLLHSPLNNIPCFIYCSQLCKHDIYNVYPWDTVKILEIRRWV